VIPFRDFGVCQDRVVRAGYAGGETAGYAVVGGVVAFGVAGRVVFVLPVAVLCCEEEMLENLVNRGRRGERRTFVESIPYWHVFVVAAYYEFSVAEIVVYDLRIGPGPVGVEECEWCV
jgi:hypothetical protein